MTEQSQMPLVGPPKRRGWREIVWFRPLTPSTRAALVVTRRGWLVSILPAGGPRALSDYLAWPYDFREVDTRERSLMLDQRLESFDGSYEFLSASCGGPEARRHCDCTYRRAPDSGCDLG